MNLYSSEQDEQIRKKVRKFAEEKVRPQIASMERDEFPQQLVVKMGEKGLMGLAIPRQYGGAGLPFTSYIVAVHELSKVSASLGVILAVHSSVGTNPILYYGNEHQKKRYIPSLAAGKLLGAFALTETGSGSDAAALKTTAKRERDTYLLRGSKMFITNAGAADTYILFASTQPEKGPRGITAFIVEANWKGFHIGKREKKMGMHGTNTSELILDQVAVPKENRLGGEGDGFKIALANLNAGRIGIAAQALGIAEGALALAENYANPSAVRASFAFKDIRAQIEASRCLVFQAAYLQSEGKRCQKEASMAKLAASKTAMETTTKVMQVFGGAASFKKNEIERYFRDAKVCEIYEGTSEIQKLVIGKHLLKAGR